MTEVMSSCEPVMEDFTLTQTPEQGRLSFQVTKRLPSIVVEPTETGEVESGELRWPPDEMNVLEDVEHHQSELTSKPKIPEDEEEDILSQPNQVPEIEIDYSDQRTSENSNDNS
ncbi:protein LBH isoform X2 [Stegostoma tigrinum]|uniref:protein LBH isoform X2 n=1 Tax=Stegostoma tigrinum TaxID=3053191 RepID=UPI00287025F4|nr:protein LBH isoform X2 [Stegostoma tigrinum]XP_059505095.1 protein LBH isoform X2 [Stegostoma tigrinum]XP_059505096.1 protein LBH isoform X2 [Stegostoma tigrinum]XP_059505097.1 protein LBH isoform X2 [Stegostoma tigrinum]